MNRMQTHRMIYKLFVLLMCFTTPQAVNITEIRLVDGPSPNEGRLEVSDSVLGWGTVCSTGWDIKDTEVVCRELGYPGANSYVSSNSPFGQGSGAIINNVECNGTEASLSECTFNDILSGCSQRDVGIICQKPGYIGCFGDSFNRLFQDAYYEDLGGMTIDACLSFCRNQSLQYAGLEYTYECYCASSGTRYDAQGTFADSECQFVCSGNSNERCGGNRRISVFDTTVGFCEDPGVPEYGTRQGDWFRYGASVTFDCAEGYNLTGNQSIQCLSVDGSPTVDWNANTPVCLGPTEIPTTNDPTTGAPSTASTTGFITTKITDPPTTEETPTSIITDGTSFNPTTFLSTTSPPPTDSEMTTPQVDTTTYATTAMAPTTYKMETRVASTTVVTNSPTRTDSITTGPLTTPSKDSEMTTTSQVDTTTYATTMAPTTYKSETRDASTAATVVTTSQTITDSITTGPLTTVDVTTSTENVFTPQSDTTLSTNLLSTSDMSSTNPWMTTPGETEVPPTTPSVPENMTGTININTDITSDTTGSTSMVIATEEEDTRQPPSSNTQAAPTTSDVTPQAGPQGGRWPWPPVGIGLLLGGIILFVLLVGLVICLIVISPRAKARKEEEEAVRLRNARQSPSADTYSPDIVLDRNGRRSYSNHGNNGIERVEDSEAYNNSAFLADDASVISVYGERQRAVENPYASFPEDDAFSGKKALFADTARKLNQICVPGSPDESTFSRGTQRSSSDLFGAQLVV